MKVVTKWEVWLSVKWRLNRVTVWQSDSVTAWQSGWRYCCFSHRCFFVFRHLQSRASVLSSLWTLHTAHLETIIRNANDHYNDNNDDNNSNTMHVSVLKIIIRRIKTRNIDLPIQSHLKNLNDFRMFRVQVVRFVRIGCDIEQPDGGILEFSFFNR